MVLPLNMRANLQAQGDAHYQRSKNSLDRIVDALKEDTPILNMNVSSGNGKKVPLDQYLSGIRAVTEVDTFFTGAPYFNIWETLPLGLTKYPSHLGISEEEAPKLLERFNAYTWNDKPELRNTYMSALRTALWVADNSLWGWTAIMNDNPDLYKAINRMVVKSEFKNLPSVTHLKTTNKNIEEIEREIEKMPKERFRDHFIPSGWKRLKQRGIMASELTPKLKRVAKEVIEPLTTVGAEYRLKHISDNYKHFL